MNEQEQRLAARLEPIAEKLLDRVELDDRQFRAVNAALVETMTTGFLMGFAEAFGTAQDHLAERGIRLNLQPDIRITRYDAWDEEGAG